MLTAAIVLVELFTSEGCSSCPPADAALLALEQSNAQVVAIEEHVDYWDHLGWRDPFSSKTFSDRQREYADALGRGRIYTPQMVVDGRRELIGSDAAGARGAIAAAAQVAKGNVSLRRDGDLLHVEVKDVPGSEPAEVRLVIAESGLSTKVERGENEGRTLRHASVARSVEWVGSVGKDRSASFQVALKTAPSWKRENLRAVVLVQAARSRLVLAAAALPL
jgi:hypothetical protein